MLPLVEGIPSVLLYIFEYILNQRRKPDKKHTSKAEREMEGEGLFMWM